MVSLRLLLQEDISCTTAQADMASKLLCFSKASTYHEAAFSNGLTACSFVLTCFESYAEGQTDAKTAQLEADSQQLASSMS